MKVIATKVGIYGSNRIRKDGTFEIPDDEPLRNWMAPVSEHISEEPDEQQTLGELADPVPKVLAPEPAKGKSKNGKGK